MTNYSPVQPLRANRQITTGAGLVLFKLDNEADTRLVAVAHPRSIDSDLNRSRMLEDVQGFPPQLSGGVRIQASRPYECKGCSLETRASSEPVG